MFSNKPLRPCGGSLGDELPLELSIYDSCNVGCHYCFSNLSRASYRQKQASIGKVGKQISKDPTESVIKKFMNALAGENPESWVNYWIQQRSPVVFSNRVDPLMPKDIEIGSTKALLHFFNELQYPVFFQTKFIYDDHPLRNIVPYIVENKNLIIYTTITTLSDDKARVIEPFAIPPSERLRRVEEMAKQGKTVVCAMNPYIHGFSERPRDLVKAFYNAGAKGVYMDFLHLSKSQVAAMSKNSRFMVDASTNKLELSADGYEIIYSAFSEFADTATELGLDYFYEPSSSEILEDLHTSPKGTDDLLKYNILDCNIRDFMNIVVPNHLENRSHILLTFSDVIKSLSHSKVLEQVFSTADLFTFYNQTQADDDTQEFFYLLGNKCKYKDFLRYVWNKSVLNRNWLWVNGCFKHVLVDGEILVDDNNDVVGCYSVGKDGVDWSTWYDTIEFKQMANDGYIELADIEFN